MTKPAAAAPNDCRTPFGTTNRRSAKARRTTRPHRAGTRPGRQLPRYRRIGALAGDGSGRPPHQKVRCEPPSYRNDAQAAQFATRGRTTVVALAGGARAAERSRLTHSHPDRHMRTELRKVSFGSDDDDSAVRTVALSWITQEPTTALRMTLQISAEYGALRCSRQQAFGLSPAARTRRRAGCRDAHRSENSGAVIGRSLGESAMTSATMLGSHGRSTPSDTALDVSFTSPSAWRRSGATGSRTGVGYGVARRYASTASTRRWSSRDSTRSSLRRIWRTCASTVLWLTNSRSAIA